MRNATALLAAGFLLAGCATTPVAPPPPPSPEQAAFAALMTRVTLDDGGDPQARALLYDGLRKTLESPSARKWALEFSKDGLPTVISVQKVEGSRMAVYNGTPYITIRAAETFVDSSSMISIHINDLMLRATDQAPNSLAHELLGHALDWSRAVKDGSSPAYEYADASELNAKLVGWIVDQDLGDRDDQYQIEDYFADTTTYMDRHRFDAPSHCMGLSRVEMGDAYAAYKKRVAQLENDRVYFKERLPSARNELLWIDHFVEVHGMKPGPFAELKAALRREARVDIPGELAVRKESELRLKQRIARFRKKKNRAILAEVAKDPLIVAWDARTAELTALLRRVYMPKESPAAPAAKSAADSINRDALKKMIDADLVGCPFTDRPY